MRLATLYRILKYGGDNSYKNLIRKWKMAIQVKPAVAFVREKARYQVQDPKLLCEALDTTSLLGKRTHAKLATLGDAVLRVALLDDWYPRASTAGKLLSPRSLMLDI